MAKSANGSFFRPAGTFETRKRYLCRDPKPLPETYRWSDCPGVYCIFEPRIFSQTAGTSEEAERYKAAPFSTPAPSRSREAGGWARPLVSPRLGPLFVPRTPSASQQFCWRYEAVKRRAPIEYNHGLEALRICGGMIVNEKRAVAGGTWGQEHFAEARHVSFAEDISIINVPIDPEAGTPVKNSLNVLRR